MSKGMYCRCGMSKDMYCRCTEGGSGQKCELLNRGSAQCRESFIPLLVHKYCSEVAGWMAAPSPRNPHTRTHLPLQQAAPQEQQLLLGALLLLLAPLQLLPLLLGAVPLLLLGPQRRLWPGGPAAAAGGSRNMHGSMKREARIR